MLKNTLKIFKNNISKKGEHGVSDKQYIAKLQDSLKTDLVDVIELFDRERQNIELCILRAEEIKIDDEYLLRKCQETLDSSVKLTRKLSKYKDSKDIKCIRFKEMYTIYSLISEANDKISIMRSYTTQLNKYNK